MAKARETKTTAPEAAQETQGGQDMAMDTQTAEAASGAAESGQEGTTARETIGPEDAPELLGGQDEDEAELEEGLLTEYAVTAEGGLRLREKPSLDARVIAVLPWGSGVFAPEPPDGEWVHVTTGLLAGYMMVGHLVPLTDALKATLEYD